MLENADTSIRELGMAGCIIGLHGEHERVRPWVSDKCCRLPEANWTGTKELET